MSFQSESDDPTSGARAEADVETLSKKQELTNLLRRGGAETDFQIKTHQAAFAVCPSASPLLPWVSKA